MTLEWFLCTDRHHEPLARRLEALVSPSFRVRVFRVEDLGGAPGRAAGGFAVQDFKLECILRALEESEATWVVWSDADVQPLVAPQDLRARILEHLGSADVYAQREFEDCGLNVGFLVLRNPEARDVVWRLRERMRVTRGLDQKVLNGLVLSGQVDVGRLPNAFWASSNAMARPALEDLVLHHANFVLLDERGDSRDPRPKLAQLDAVAAMRRGDDTAAWRSLLDRICADASLAKYRDRHFPETARRQWLQH